MDYDSPWKAAANELLEPMLAFFFPVTHGEIDWTADCESLEQEMLKLLPESETGKRFVDKLMKVRHRGGDDRYLHVEIQARREDDFARRVVQYNDKAEDRHRHPVVSVAILIDDDPAWRPNVYVYEEWGYRKRVEFPLVKTADWREREAELWHHPNVFALVVLAHLIGRRTGQDEEREREKLRLLLRLSGRKVEGVEIDRWYALLDWLMPLPREADSRVMSALQTHTKEPTMPYVTFADRMAREQARKEGKAEGRAEGIRNGLVIVLRSRFGEDGAALAASLPTDLTAERLDALIAAAGTAPNLDAVRRAALTQ